MPVLHELPRIDEQEQRALGGIGHKQVDGCPGEGVAQVPDGLDSQRDFGTSAGCILGTDRGDHCSTTLVQVPALCSTVIGSNVIHMQRVASYANGNDVAILDRGMQTGGIHDPCGDTVSTGAMVDSGRIRITGACGARPSRE